jgi:hypothetical protein
MNDLDGFIKDLTMISRHFGNNVNGMTAPYVSLID